MALVAKLHPAPPLQGVYLGAQRVPRSGTINGRPPRLGPATLETEPLERGGRQALARSKVARVERRAAARVALRRRRTRGQRALGGGSGAPLERLPLNKWLGNSHALDPNAADSDGMSSFVMYLGMDADDMPEEVGVMMVEAGAVPPLIALITARSTELQTAAVGAVEVFSRTSAGRRALASPFRAACSSSANRRQEGSGWCASARASRICRQNQRREEAPLRRQGVAAGVAQTCGAT